MKMYGKIMEESTSPYLKIPQNFNSTLTSRSPLSSPLRMPPFFLVQFVDDSFPAFPLLAVLPGGAFPSLYCCSSRT